MVNSTIYQYVVHRPGRESLLSQ